MAVISTGEAEVILQKIDQGELEDPWLDGQGVIQTEPIALTIEAGTTNTELKHLNGNVTEGETVLALANGGENDVQVAGVTSESGTPVSIDPVSANSEYTLSNGNLTATNNVQATAFYGIYSDVPESAREVYFEVTLGATYSGGLIGFTTTQNIGANVYSLAGTYCIAYDGTKYIDGVNSGASPTFTANDIIGVVYKPSTGAITAYVNSSTSGVSLGSVAPNTSMYAMMCSLQNGATMTVNFGATPFVNQPANTVPFNNIIYTTAITGFTNPPTSAGIVPNVVTRTSINAEGKNVIEPMTLVTINSATTSSANITPASGVLEAGDRLVLDGIERTILTDTFNNPDYDVTFTALSKVPTRGYVIPNRTLVVESNVNDEFETVTYTGNGGTQTLTSANITGGIDFVWYKSRGSARNHGLQDTIRGITNRLRSNTTDVEDNTPDCITAVSTDSFSVGTNTLVNNSGEEYVAWCASLPTHVVSNTNGSITSETKSNSFMSVISYAGDGVVGATIGHGLTQAPELFLVKRRAAVATWYVYAAPLGNTKFLELNTTAAEQIGTEWNDTTPSASVITLGTAGDVNFGGEPDDYIGYAFTSVPGLCKVGSYTGTGSAGNAVDCGFEPAFIMIKRTDSTGNWLILDNSRGVDATDYLLYPDLSNAEGSGSNYMEFTSTGFITSQTDGRVNASGGNYIFLAIAGGSSTLTTTGVTVEKTATIEIGDTITLEGVE